MSDTQPIPFPWEMHDQVEPGDIRGWVGILGEGAGGVHAYVCDEATASLLLRACNSHDALLAACEQVNDYFGGRDEVDPELCPTEHSLIVQVSDAIAQAKATRS